MKIPESNKIDIQIIADECVDKENVDFLRNLGFDVKTTKELKLDGTSNGTLLKVAVGKKKLFLTQNQDFCNILLYPPRSHHGVVVLKFNALVADQVRAVLKKVLTELNVSDFDKTLIVVDKDRYRLRRE